MNVKTYDRLSTALRPAEVVLIFGLSLMMWPFLSRVELLVEMNRNGASERLLAVGAETVGIASLTAAVTTIAAYFAGYYLAFWSRRGATIAILILLPYAVSYYAHLIGMHSLAELVVRMLPDTTSSNKVGGYSTTLMVIAMVIRYFPLSVLFVYWRMRGMPRSQLDACWNLGVSPISFHYRILLRHSRVMVLFVGLFLLCLTAMDELAPSLGAGGRIQTIGSVVEDWSRTHSMRDLAVSFSGAVALLVALLILALSLPLVREGATPHPSLPAESGRRRPTWDGLLGAVLGGSAVAAFLFAQFWWVGTQTLGTSWLETFKDALVTFPRAIIWNSAWAAALASVSAALLGLGSAFAMHLTRHPGLRRIQSSAAPAAMLLPLLLPPLALAICLRESLRYLDASLGSWWAVGLAHLFVYLPIAWFLCASAGTRLGPDLGQAARNHGVPPSKYFARIFLRFAFAPLLAGAALVFFLSMNEATLSPYLCGFDRTIGEYIRRSHVAGLQASESAILSILSMGTVLALAGGGLVVGKALRPRPLRTGKHARKRGG